MCSAFSSGRRQTFALDSTDESQFACYRGAAKLAPAKIYRPYNVGGRRLGTGRFDLTRDRLSENFQEVFPPEGFGKKTSGALLHRFITVRRSSLRTDEYNRHMMISPGQFAMKFQAAHAG